MELIRLILVVLVMIFAGWNVISLTSLKKNYLYRSEELAIAYGLGLGCLSLQIFLGYFLSLNFSLLAISLPWVAVFLIRWVLSARHETKDMMPNLARSRWDALSVMFALGITFETAYAFFRALIRPIESYDAIAIYAIKSKVFYLANCIPADFFQSIAKLFPHPDYPLNIPIAQTLVYAFLGNLNDQLVKVIFPLFFIGLLGVFYFAVRRFSTRRYALLFTFILAGVPQFNNYATNAYMDLPLAYYVFVSAVCLFEWIEDRSRPQLLVISALAAGLAGWTKNEGLMYCAINIVLLIVFIASNAKKVTNKGVLLLILYAGIIALVLIPWIYIKKISGITNDEVYLSDVNMQNLIKQAGKIKPILYEFQKQFFGPKKWNILWPAAFSILLFNYRRLFKGINRYITLSLVFAVFGYILSYLISHVEISYFVGKSWSRFLIHFLPVVLYLVARVAKEEIDA